MEAAFLQGTVGAVVAKGCADIIASAPPDPIDHLSLWLLKYVANTKITHAFFQDRELVRQQQQLREQTETKHTEMRVECAREEAEAIRRLREIQEADPYLLFDSCLKTVKAFTGCSSAYIALVLDKQWEPPRKILDSEEEEGLKNEDEEEEVEEEEKEEVDEQEAIEDVDTDDVTQSNEVLQDQQEVLKIEKVKPKKPIKYNKKVLLYVATTSNNDFLINKQLDKKLGPATFSLLLQQLPKLHIPNVLYQEGIHFFQGMPLMGAYLTIPIILPTDPIQVVALLCADTLRKQNIDTGRPFSPKEQEFIVSVSEVITEVLMGTGLGTSNSFNTKEIIQKLQNEIKQLNKSHKAELRREKLRDSQVRGTDDVLKEEVDMTENKDGEEIKSDDDMENKTDDEAKEEEEEGEEEDEEEEEEEEEEEGEAAAEEEEEEEEEAEGGEGTENDEQGDDEKQLREVGKLLKQQQKKVTILQKQFQKSQSVLEKQSVKVMKLEKKVRILDGALSHLLRIRTMILDTLVQHKDDEFKRIKQCLFPTSIVHRILKGLLFVLGQPHAVIQDWTKTRQILNGDYICSAMEDYKPLTNEDLKSWELCDSYTEGITNEKLFEESPIGYLCQQWLIVAKKVAFKIIKLNTYKIKNDKAAKEFADAELEQMVAEIDLGVAMDEEKKVNFRLEQLQCKVSNEISSAPNDEDEEIGED